MTSPADTGWLLFYMSSIACFACFAPLPAALVALPELALPPEPIQLSQTPESYQAPSSPTMTLLVLPTPVQERMHDAPCTESLSCLSLHTESEIRAIPHQVKIPSAGLLPSCS
ncbi:hypothetical protein BGZ63DRAFT_385324 [Mariannaea sp. PMI_226]|nr:hypothetical protein BGZ63DRAFT_385324 [Mariannaea sp. PMI_226]